MKSIYYDKSIYDYINFASNGNIQTWSMLDHNYVKDKRFKVSIFSNFDIDSDEKMIYGDLKNYNFKNKLNTNLKKQIIDLDFSFLQEFISQSKKEQSQKTFKYKNYWEIFPNLNIKVSFGFGSFNKVAYISFLGNENITSKGIYPVYLHYKEQKKIVLALGISEQEESLRKWPEFIYENSTTIEDYLEEKIYGNSFIYKVYDDNLNSEDLFDLKFDLIRLLSFYEKILNDELLDEEDWHTNFEFSELPFQSNINDKIDEQNVVTEKLIKNEDEDELEKFFEDTENINKYEDEDELEKFINEVEEEKIVFDKDNSLEEDTSDKDNSLEEDTYDKNNYEKTENNNFISKEGKDIVEIIQIQKKCPITKISDVRLLEKTIIKKDCNEDEINDIYNYLVLVPTYSKLFREGFISFDLDGKIILSPFIDYNEWEKLGLTELSVYEDVSNENNEIYLKYHRDNIFKN